MRYTPHTDEEIKQMLDTIGVASVEELFKDIPEDLRAKSFDIPSEKSEFEAMDIIKGKAEKNLSEKTLFMGGGFYDHYIPSVVDDIASRSEFYTAYTPYQPEASQGTLQSLFEYQTAICELTGMEASNASLYDGGTAIAEAVLMALRSKRKRKKIIIDANVNPLYKKIVYTYLKNLDVEVSEIDSSDLSLNREKLIDEIDKDVAAVVLQNPNFYGTIDDYSDITEKAKDKKALSIISVNPLSLGILKTPGEMGADIVTGEGQCLGLPLNFGGPYLGIIASKKKYLRKLPGRIVGETQDTNGKRGYVLTIQTREQHIRREKATSNICSNQNLCALRALVYMSSIGKKGIKEVASQCYEKTYYAREVLGSIPKVEVKNKKDVFNEFVVEFPVSSNEVFRECAKEDLIPGLPLSRFSKDLENQMLVAVTEKRSKQEIDQLADIIKNKIKN